MESKYTTIFADFLAKNHQIAIIQAENPDGDSLGASLALYEALSPTHQVSLYCEVQIPKYLRYLKNWGLVLDQFDFQADAYLIIDTSSSLLLAKTLENSAIKHALSTKPVLVIDHHSSPSDLPFEHQIINPPASASAETVFNLLKSQNISLNLSATEGLYTGIASDTLGLSTENITAKTFHIVAELINAGLKISELENRRHEFLKKSPKIFDYKADLIKRVDYHLDGALAIVHIPWEEIKTYSNEYNPGALILEELRFVEGVQVGVAIKTYPDGKITGKIRTTTPIAEQLAGFFGGGGHPFASGFKVYDHTLEAVIKDLVQTTYKLIKNHESTH